MTTLKDALFIQEIINDLERGNHYAGSKARTMLHDWSRELKDRAGLCGKRKRVFAKECGLQYW